MSESSRADGAPEEARLAELGVLRVLAGNAGPFTLAGTNTWVLGRDPAYVVDPGPDEQPHLTRLLALLDSRGGLGGIALTHDHEDHGGALAALRARMPAPIAAGRAQPGGGGAQPGGGGSQPGGGGSQPGGGGAQVELQDGASFGPLRAFATPGHSSDHFAFVFGSVCFTGDAVLGEGSVFLTPDRGALAGYLAGLRRLAELPLSVICPGHGPPIWEPRERLHEYVAHRLEREQRLRAALADGRRTAQELLDAAWGEVPAALRPLAVVTLAAHLDKLDEEAALPAGVERPTVALP